MMRAMTLAELQQPLDGKLVGSNVSFSEVFTDSRRVVDGGLFVALAGENFDGNDYVGQVGDAGAAAALVSRPCDTAIPQLQVLDTQRALGKLGAFNRELYLGPLVAITGSSGKKCPNLTPARNNMPKALPATMTVAPKSGSTISNRVAANKTAMGLRKPCHSLRTSCSLRTM